MMYSDDESSAGQGITRRYITYMAVIFIFWQYEKR